jgi:hypothetical protein
MGSDAKEDESVLPGVKLRLANRAISTQVITVEASCFPGVEKCQERKFRVPG